MVTLFRTMKSLTLGGVECIVRVRSDGAKLTVEVGPKTLTTGSTSVLSYSVTYGDETRSAFYIFGNMEFTFDYTGLKKVVIADTAVTLDGVSSDSYTVTWTAEPSEMLDMTSAAEYSFNCIRANTSSTLTLKLAPPEGIHAKVILFRYTLCDEWISTYENVDCTYSYSSGVYTYTNSMSSSMCVAKSKIQYRVEIAYYASEAASRVNGGESFIGYADILTPNYIICASSDQSVPFSLEYPTPIAGAPLQITWGGHDDALIFYLARSVNGGSFSSVYTGGKKSFTDTVGKNWNTVKYRIGSAGSIWWTGDSKTVKNTNIYVGTAGGIKSASGLYIGENGALRSVIPIMSVGGM